MKEILRPFDMLRVVSKVEPRCVGVATLWPMAIMTLCCLLLPGCSGGGGLGSGSATLRLTISQLPGTGFLPPPAVAGRAIGFDEGLVGGGDVIQGLGVRIVREGGDLDIEATSSGQGQVLIGALGRDTYLLTLRGTDPSEAVTFPLIVEGPAALVMRARLERDEGGILMNAQAINDLNIDGTSDDGYRLTITGQRPAGGGTLIIHHSRGKNVTAAETELRITASLEADGHYAVLGEPLIDTDDDGLANDSADELDIDGDGILDTEDTDIDGDGILNHSDPDVDGDHLPNATDDDADGDGIPNAEDDTPLGPAPTA